MFRWLKSVRFNFKNRRVYFVAEVLNTMPGVEESYLLVPSQVMVTNNKMHKLTKVNAIMFKTPMDAARYRLWYTNEEYCETVDDYYVVEGYIPRFTFYFENHRRLFSNKFYFGGEKM